MSSQFNEVADRVWVARYPWLDVNVSMVAGEAGLLVLDTQASAALAREVVADLRQVSASRSGGPSTATSTGTTPSATACSKPPGPSWSATRPPPRPCPSTPPRCERRRPKRTRCGQMWRRPTSSSRTHVLVGISLDLGDRLVELVHPGRGHTGGDLVVRVPDADVVLAGDLVEQTDRGRPAFGSDCYPMEWPLTLDVVLSLPRGPVVVPGHGAVVDRDFVEVQRNEIGIVAETIRDLATRGVTVDDALAGAEWPYPREALEHAVRRGYEHLPSSQKRLPLV